MEWYVDDRPASPYTRLYVRWMWWRRDKRAFEGERHTRHTARERQASGDHPPGLLTRLRVRVMGRKMAGMQVWVARPRKAAPVASVVYLHGGGYIHPLTPDYWRLVRALVSVPAEVVVVAYPLAPDATVDDVLPRLAEVARTAGSAAPIPVVLMGDSAGGALALTLAATLRDDDSKTPVSVVGLCPWLDATLDDEAVVELEASDPMLAESGLRAAGRWWSGPRHPSDPLVSPVHLDLTGLPPIDVFIGDRDILRPAVDELAEQARRVGADLTVHEVTSMFHVWMTRAIPEARRTRRELVQLVRRRAGAD